MFSFRKKMNRKESIDLLEYLAFQTKSGASFKESLQRYVAAGRNEIVTEVCLRVIDSISRGVRPADSLLDAEVINPLEYTLISNAQNPYEALYLAVQQGKESGKSSDALKSSIRGGLFMLSGLLMLIPFFREDIEGIYMMFAQMSVMASGEHATPQVPFLVKKWWSVFVVIGAIGSLYFAVSLMFKWIYSYHGHIYYRMFGYVMHRDVVAILTSLRQMGRAMSWSSAYATLAKSAPNSYWGELFESVAENLKNGGKASEMFGLQRGVIPLETIHCFMDGEDTGEVDIYLQKAIEYSKHRFDKSQEQIRIAVPIFFDLLMYFLIGLVAVKFTSDMNDLGIMQVLTQI